MAYSNSCFLGYMRVLDGGSMVGGMTLKSCTNPKFLIQSDFSSPHRLTLRSHERKTSPESSKWKKSTFSSSVRTLSIWSQTWSSQKRASRVGLHSFFQTIVVVEEGRWFFFLACCHTLNIINMWWLGYVEDKTCSEPRVSGFQLDTSILADLAQHYLMRANITAIRRVRKTDNNRIARWVGQVKIRFSFPCVFIL